MKADLNNKIERNTVNRILIADDDPDILMLYSVLLARDGYTTVLAEDGLSAYNIVTSASPEEAFDLLITDIQMPTLDGIELVEALRKDNCNLPVLYITGAGEEKFYERLRASTMTHILYKPFEYSALTREVHDILCKDEKCEPVTVS